MFYSYYGDGNYGQRIAVLPDYDAASNPLVSLYFKYRTGTSYNTTNLQLRVGYINASDIADGAFNINNFHTIGAYQAYGTTKDTACEGITIPAGARLAFMWYNNYSSGSSYYYCGIDDIKLTNCVKPTDIAVTNIAHNSVSLAWRGNSSSYLVEYGTAAQGNANNTKTVVNDTTFTLNGLSQTTTYHFYIRSLCSSVDTSNTSTITVTTPCPSASLPYSEDFSSYSYLTSYSTTVTSTYLPTCWDFLSSGTYPMSNSSSYWPRVCRSSDSYYAYPTSSNNYLLLYSDYNSTVGTRTAVMPPLDLGTNQGVNLSFKYCI